VAATLGVIGFNWLSATGRLGSSPGTVSAKYETLLTPASYAFSIWGLIYLGLVLFSLYQLLPANLLRFRAVRSLYIFSCALNCAWLYFWHGEHVVICFVIILALSVTLLVINYQLRDPASLSEAWLTKATFGIYFGWVTVATLINLVVVLKFGGPALSGGAENAIAIVWIIAAAALAVIVTLKLSNHFYPLAIAWALTAIAVKQSGQTLIVVAAAVGVVTCLIASLSFVMNLRSSDNP
jgi:hypothetical protein